MKQLIIGMAGRKRSGKTTVSNILTKHGFEIGGHINETMVDMTKVLLDYAKINYTSEHFEGDKKEDLILKVRDISFSARDLMRAFGKEFRDALHEDLFISLWLEKCRHIPLLISQSCRFPNEAKIIRDMGGFIIRLRAPHDNDFLSERERMYEPEIEGDVEIFNDLNGMDRLIREVEQKVLPFIGDRISNYTEAEYQEALTYCNESARSLMERLR